jgi:hypothetical protein
MRLFQALLPVILVAGCVSAPRPAGPDTRVLAGIVAMAADQVKRCYRAPRVAREGRQITTVLRVRYGTDGMLTGLPQVVAQTGITESNRIYAARMAEAASLAVIQCAPIRMPAEYYHGGWDEFDLTFSPRAVA